MEKRSVPTIARARALVLTTDIKSIRQLEDVLRGEGYADWKIGDPEVRRELINQMRSRPRRDR